MKTYKKLAAFGLALCLPFSVSADNHEAPPNVGSSWTMTPKDMIDSSAFEAAMMEHVKWRDSKGDPRDWDVYEVAVGPDVGTYVVRVCCFAWADQDDYIKWSRDNDAGEHFAKTVGPHLEKISHTLPVVDIENSNWGDVEHNYVGVSSMKVLPGMGMQMEEAMSTMSQMAKEKGWPRSWAWFTNVGGDAHTHLASPYMSYADMAPPEQSFMDFASEHMGADEAAAMMKSYTDSIESSSYRVYVKRSDLSVD